MPYGAFVEFMPGKEGLLHISEISWERLESMETSGLHEGDEVDVKLIEVDKKTGKFRLSMKALKEKPEGYEERPRQPRRDDRGPRRDDRRRDDRRRDERGPRRDDRRRDDRGPRRFEPRHDNNNEGGAPEGGNEE